MSHVSYVSGPEFTDPDPDSDGFALPVSGLQGDPPAVPRGKRPSELPGAAVAAVAGSYLTVAQAAVLLGVTPRRVRALVSRGFLRAKAVNPRLLLIRRSDLKYVAVRSPGRPKG